MCGYALWSGAFMPLDGQPQARAAAAEDAELLEEQLQAAALLVAAGQSPAQVLMGRFDLIKNANALKQVIKRRGLPDGTLRCDDQEFCTPAEKRRLVAAYAAAGLNTSGGDGDSISFFTSHSRAMVSSRGGEVSLTKRERRWPKAHLRWLLAPQGWR